jgi:hypothetical protein
VVVYVRGSSEWCSGGSTGQEFSAVVWGFWSVVRSVMALGERGMVVLMETKVAVSGRVPDFFRATEYGGSVGMM